MIFLIVFFSLFTTFLLISYWWQTERMKDEALSKLKDLGNNILGKFGMSLDNFKVEKGEDGGYSVQMNQGTQSQ